jgi:hypothetical protein
MGCFAGLLARVALFFVWISTPLVGRAFHDGWILPLLGIFFLPVTTIAYVLVFAIGGSVAGRAWLWVVLAFLFDLAIHGPISQTGRRRTQSSGGADVRA